MFSRLLSSLSAAWILVILTCQDSAGKRMWEFEPVSVVTTSSDLKKFKPDLYIARVGRGEVAFSGTIEWNYDVDETTMIEGVSHRSTTGAEEDYTQLPWNLAKTRFKEYINGFYKEIIYINLKDCSNVPRPDVAYPWARGNYKVDKCVFTGDGLPDYVPEAYYKFSFKTTGEVEWTIVLIVKVVKKLASFG